MPPSVTISMRQRGGGAQATFLVYNALLLLIMLALGDATVFDGGILRAVRWDDHENRGGRATMTVKRKGDSRRGVKGDSQLLNKGDSQIPAKGDSQRRMSGDSQ